MLTLAEEAPTYLVDLGEAAGVVREALAETVGDTVARATYEAVCELRGRIPDPGWRPPRRPLVRVAEGPEGLDPQAQARADLRLDRQRIRQEAEERARQLAEAQQIAERAVRAALPTVGVGPCGAHTPELVDVGDGWLLPRMPGAWRGERHRAARAARRTA